MGGSRALAQGWALVAGQLGAAGPPTLGTLILSPATGTVGQAYTGTLSGATQGSTIVLDNMTVTGTGVTRTVTGTPSAAGTWGATETLAGAVGSPKTTPSLFLVSAASAVINLTGAAARVAITDASYWIRTSGTLARTTDTNYENALRASSTAKTIPFPSGQTVGPGTIGYVSIKHDAVTADVSPPLFINWDGNQAQPTAANPAVPTVWFSADSTDGSPDTGTWTQDTSFAAFRPSTVTDLAYGGRGQRYFWPTAAARWVQVRFDATGLTQAFTPHICCSSGQWIWEVGMSIIRNQFTSISTLAANRNAIIAAVPGSDPFFFVSARSGANQQAIIDEQVTPVTGSSTLLKFIRGIRANTTINDLAFSGARPYSALSQANRDLIGSRFTSILSTLKGLGRVLVVADTTYGNYSTATPAVNGDLQSANGNFPFVLNVLGPIHKAQVPGSWDAAYDWPYVMQSAAMANTYETAMADEVHPNGTGYTPQFKTTEIPSLKLLYGASPGPNTMQSIVSGLGSSTTTALKTRAQAVFDMAANQYPTDPAGTAATNRATLRNQLDAIPAA